LFRVATVPSSTTFTLDGVTGNGLNNSGTITITTRSVAFIQTSASTAITTGKSLSIAGVATMTIAKIQENGSVGTAGASGTFRVGVGGTGTRFLIEGINTVGIGNNSGTITITEYPQEARFTGAALLTQYSTTAGIVSADTYSQITVQVQTPQVLSGGNAPLSEHAVTFFFNESQANSSLVAFNLYKAFERGYVR
jgi:hypothetical protein